MNSIRPVAVGQWIPWQTVANEIEAVRAKGFEPYEVCVHDGGGDTVQLWHRGDLGPGPPPRLHALASPDGGQWRPD